MHIVDLSIFIAYILVMLGIGFFFHKRNKDIDDYYVGGRKMSSLHIGLSVVATDVGGGFSIGLGGLGFAIGLSGSWMLFTGLIGAWLSAVILIPRIKRLSKSVKLYTFPQIFETFYNHRVALLAGIISAIGYIGFTSSQLLAGAKLASATFIDLNLNHALLLMGVVAIVYTVLGGLKAVIYTDSVQWAILMTGLIFIGIPFSYEAIGGMKAIKATVGPEFLSLDNVSWQDLLNWFVTIVPIWFVGMTLYQRIYASRNEKEARKAWYIAGIFEWPIMAFMGVLLGLFAKVAFENGMFFDMGYETRADLDAEMGLPLLLRNILPFGLMGLILSAYFSAILSTADSCLMAASGNLLSDIIGKFGKFDIQKKKTLFLSKILTFVIGGIALFIAWKMKMVLELMLYSYAFMVSGLFVPVLAALLSKYTNSVAAFLSMLIGGSTTLTLIIIDAQLPLNLDPNIFGISASVVVYFIAGQVFYKYRKLKRYEV
ncbi:MAG: sodium:solute symporter family protein [Bacteroidales bacterium]|nr:sodium:solute symporter family protein [Bacteroidales bacterium]MCF8388450.1 sodium:solute symporter family protein [Bacteroidales bacterium]